jgi:nucleoporin NUP42
LTSNNNAGGLPYQLSKEAIEKDISSECPQWILSSYGPGKDAPEQLFGGPQREQSTDEIRWYYSKMKGEGKEQQAVRG